MEVFWLLVLSIAVIVAVALFKKYAVPVVGMGALLTTVVACGLAAVVYVKFITSGGLLELAVAALIIYAVSNLGFQIITYFSGPSNRTAG